jgi:hypothetical protein
MAYINPPALNDIPMGGTFSNHSSHHSTFTPAAATTAGDKVRLVKLQAGTKLLDATAFVEDAVINLTLSLGYEYVDSSLSGSNDAAYFFSAKDVAAGGKFRADVNKPPVELVADAYLVATLGAAVFATTNKLDVITEYDFTGHD